MSTLRNLAALAILALGQHLSAQQDSVYTIRGHFNPVIADVRKIDLRPQSIDSILPTKPLTYELLTVKGEVAPRVDSIAPVKLNVGVKQEKLYHGYTKAGFGLYTTPLFELYYDQTRNRSNGYGLHYKHMSSNGGLSDVGPSDYSFNNVDGFYKGFFSHHEFGGRVTYDRRRINYYGYSPDQLTADSLEQPSDDDLKMIYNDIGFTARIKSLYRDSSLIAHDVAMDVHAYSDLKSVRSELNVRISADLSKEDGSETYGLGVLIDNNSYRNKGIDYRQSGTILGLMPNVTTSNDVYQVKVGVGMYLDAMDKTTFHFFPQVYAEYSLFDDILVPYAGLDGFRQRNNFRSITRENPWVARQEDLPGTQPHESGLITSGFLNSSQMYDFYAGLRGSFSSQMGFDVRLSKSRMDARPLYVNDASYSYGNAFLVVYDQVDQLDISGSLNYNMGERATISGRLDIYAYETKTQTEAWNLPPYAISLLANWNLFDKLMIKAEAQFMGRRTGLSYSPYDLQESGTTLPVEREMQGYMDLYLGAEYRYTKRLSLFVDLSNVSASKYEKWYRYPVQRTLLMGGATFAF